MNRKTLPLILIAGALSLLSVAAIAVPLPSDIGVAVEREASEGPRGGDNERPGDRQRRGGRGPGLIEQPVQVDPPAREASERPGDRQRRGGRGRG